MFVRTLTGHDSPGREKRVGAAKSVAQGLIFWRKPAYVMQAWVKTIAFQTRERAGIRWKHGACHEGPSFEAAMKRLSTVTIKLIKFLSMALHQLTLSGSKHARILHPFHEARRVAIHQGLSRLVLRRRQHFSVWDKSKIQLRSRKQANQEKARKGQENFLSLCFPLSGLNAARCRTHIPFPEAHLSF